MTTIEMSNYRKIALQAKKDHNLTNLQHSMYETCLLNSIQKNTKENVTSANTGAMISVLQELSLAELIYVRRRDVKTYTATLR